MERFVRTIESLSRLCGILAVILMILALLSVCHMVIVRGILGEAVIWQTEFATFALVGATFIGSPYVLMVRGHVNVELLPLKLASGPRYVLAIVTALAALAFCVAVLANSVEWWWEAYDGGWTTDSIWRPRLWIYYAALPVGMLILCLQYVADIWSVISGRTPPFGMMPGGQGAETGDAR